MQRWRLKLIHGPASAVRYSHVLYPTAEEARAAADAWNQLGADERAEAAPVEFDPSNTHPRAPSS